MSTDTLVARLARIASTLDEGYHTESLTVKEAIAALTAESGVCDRCGKPLTPREATWYHRECWQAHFDELLADETSTHPPAGAGPQDWECEPAEDLHVAGEQMSLTDCDEMLNAIQAILDEHRLNGSTHCHMMRWKFRTFATPAEAGPQDRRDAVLRLRAFVRLYATGCCKMLSRGAECECPLCDLDRLAAPSTPQGETKA